MFRAVCVVAVLLSAGAAFGLPIVTNGDFQTTDFTGWSIIQPNYLSVVTADNTNYYAQTANPVAYQQFQQLVPLVAGQQYVLSADVAAWTSDVLGESGTATVDLLYGLDFYAAKVLGGAVSYTNTTSDMSWHHVESAPFTAQSTDYYLATWFTGTGYTFLNVAASFDNISITPVPEPGTIALLVTGLVGLAVYVWRKRR
jgi:hypothetical protein